MPNSITLIYSQTIILSFYNLVTVTLIHPHIILSSWLFTAEHTPTAPSTSLVSFWPSGTGCPLAPVLLLIVSVLVVNAASLLQVFKYASCSSVCSCEQNYSPSCLFSCLFLHPELPSILCMLVQYFPLYQYNVSLLHRYCYRYQFMAFYDFIWLRWKNWLSCNGSLAGTIAVKVNFLILFFFSFLTCWDLLMLYIVRLFSELFVY